MSRDVTVAGYVIVAVAMIGVQLVAVLRGRPSTLGQVLQPLKGSLPGRLVLLAGWLWAGWHLFVRADWG